MTQTSQPVHVVAIITGKPGTGDLIEPMLKDLAAGTHGEAGCLLYGLQRGIENPDQFTTVEKWTSLEALGEHMQSAHIQKALTSAGEYLAGPPVIVPGLPVVAGDAAKSDY
ncbi:quinol monooxygenase YgiN [Nakamurella sp. UYEF19]|uniref:putative quinol monooxygenase n=1 Tax=Nakamurella sp. UYEF19 TaxID=1756392 RepID=UPI0033964889